jgi:hypothetical protein
MISFMSTHVSTVQIYRAESLHSLIPHEPLCQLMRLGHLEKMFILCSAIGSPEMSSEDSAIFPVVLIVVTLFVDVTAIRLQPEA